MVKPYSISPMVSLKADSPLSVLYPYFFFPCTFSAVNKSTKLHVCPIFPVNTEKCCSVPVAFIYKYS